MAATATLTATSLEGQVLEAARELSQLESAELAKPAADRIEGFTARRVTITPNLTAGTVAVTVTLPATIADTANGMSIVAAPYLP